MSPELYQQLVGIQQRLTPEVDYEWAVTLSGREANDLFLNQGGSGFLELSGISGFDSEADGRVVARFDYDRDGYQDLAVVNANAPRLQIFRNRLGDLRRARTSEGSFRDFVAVRAPSACGVRLELEGSSGRRWSREVHCGEGFAAQNSATELFGVGDQADTFELSIRWPSGETRVVEGVAAGTLIELGIGSRSVALSDY